MEALFNKLESGQLLSQADFEALLTLPQGTEADALFLLAGEAARRVFGNNIYIRGLIELSSHCKNNCYYCGIRAGNTAAQRYRLTREEVLSSADAGYRLGFRTFVLQGGEDPGISDEAIEDILRTLKANHPDCALTLSLGEKDHHVYKAWFDAGADRYLLRHETATPAHYAKLHPAAMSHTRRLACLEDLKDIGYQVGTGFMVGAPYGSISTLAEDLAFIQDFRPHMVGIGPYLRHKDTPLSHFPSGSLHQTLLCIAILRLMLPGAMIPATTALGTIAPNGREQGILAGANVVMPNLSPPSARGKYTLYDNKLHTGEEAAEGRRLLDQKLAAIGYRTTVGRGDYVNASR